MQVSIYNELWNLLADSIYGAEAVLTADQNLTLTIVCTLGALFVVAVPFLLVWRLLRMLG